LFLKVIKPYAFSFLLLVIPVLLFGQTPTEKRKKLEAERKALIEKIESTKKVIAETQTKQKATITQLKLITNKIKTRQEVIANIQSEIYEVDMQIAEQRRTLDTLKADLERLKAEYAKSISAAYKSRNVYDKMMYVFAAESFNQALTRMRYLNQYSEYRVQQAELIYLKQKEIIAQLESLIARRLEKQSLVRVKTKEKKELEQDKQEEGVVLTKLQERESALKRQLAANQKAASKLNKAIEDIIAKEIEAARKREEARRKEEAAKAVKEGKVAPKISTSKSDMYFTPEVEKLSADFEKNKNNLPWPVEKGYISEPYGTHPHPTIKGAMVNNNGVDIATNPGTQVRAVFAGKVKFIRNIPGMGIVVLIGHGRFYTAYAKLESVNVKEGQEINIKDIIGVVMTDEEENATEVHFEIWNMDKKENPEFWLKNR
jgi:septal ring factor EnvC (AmiA/AmiB activator)